MLINVPENRAYLFESDASGEACAAVERASYDGQSFETVEEAQPELDRLYALGFSAMPL